MIPGNPKTLGLSPLARGTLTSRLAYLLLVGITPAHAGTTTLGLATHACAQDHPRSRGDHHDEPPLHIPLQGSPPLARGPRTAAACQAHPERITPAHAGTTTAAHECSYYRQDHPRSRGDHVHSLSVYHPVKGSPPLARGPQNYNPSMVQSQRITPAHAGTTHQRRRSSAFSEDHPRSRGDHWMVQCAENPAVGSPPLTRGPPRRRDEVRLHHGITPAHAGTTSIPISQFVW